MGDVASMPSIHEDRHKRRVGAQVTAVWMVVAPTRVRAWESPAVEGIRPEELPRRSALACDEVLTVTPHRAQARSYTSVMSLRFGWSLP